MTNKEAEQIRSYYPGTREFTSGNGTVRLLVHRGKARLMITPYEGNGAVFERDYDLDQVWMAERDFQTLYRAIWG